MAETLRIQHLKLFYVADTQKNILGIYYNHISAQVTLHHLLI